MGNETGLIMVIVFYVSITGFLAICYWYCVW